MKKIILTVLTAIMLLGAVGCTKTTTASSHTRIHNHGDDHAGNHFAGANNAAAGIV